MGLKGNLKIPKTFLFFLEMDGSEASYLQTSPASMVGSTYPLFASGIALQQSYEPQILEDTDTSVIVPFKPLCSQNGAFI